MRWQLYLEQTQGSGDIALAIAALCFGFFSWWYLVKRLPWLERWRKQATTAFWILIALIYFSFLGWLFFAWPR